MTLLPSAKSAARLQMVTALLMLSVMAALSGTLDILTRSKPVAAWFDRKNEESWRQTRDLPYHIGYWQSPEEPWLYEDLPHMDFAKGGVYFFGSSSVAFSTKFWELPPDLQAVLHNFGMPACNQESELVLLRFLIEQKGMLEAGGEKTLVVLGTSYHTVFYPSRGVTPGFVDGLERHGLFACDAQQGIRELPVNALSKFVDFEKTRQAACMTRLRDVFLHQLSRWRHHGAEPPRILNPAFYDELRRQEMEPDWRKKIDESIQVFRETIDYLRARHVQIRVALMPGGSWEDSLPYEAEYRRQIIAVCAGQQIPVSDWSRLLSDEDFADSVHLDIFGMEKIQPAFLDIALPFLRSTGALPATPSAPNQSGK